MTKLEQKLIELGYKQDQFISTIFYGEIKNDCRFHKDIFLNDLLTEVKAHKVTPFCAFRAQQDIDDLQQAFNELQKDLEILKECEE